MTFLRTLIDREDVSDEMLDIAVETLAWFEGQSLPTEDFIDRFCEGGLNGIGWDIDNYNSPAVQRIMRHVRRVRSLDA